MTRVQFFKYYHHLINPRLYSEDQIKQRNQTILVANWKRYELEREAAKNNGGFDADHQAQAEVRSLPA